MVRLIAGTLGAISFGIAVICVALIVNSFELSIYTKLAKYLGFL